MVPRLVRRRHSLLNIYHHSHEETYNLRGHPADFLGRKFNDAIFGLKLFFVKNDQH